MSALLAGQTPRGEVVHLIREGEALTLCGRPHGVNVRYVRRSFGWTLPVEEVNCRTCLRLRVAIGEEESR